MNNYVRWSLLFLWTWLTWYLTGVPNLRVVPDSFEQFLISKGGHIFFFGIEGVLVYLAIASKKWRFAIALFLASALGAATELHQHFVPGRHMNIWDWALDTASALLFLVIIKKKL